MTVEVIVPLGVPDPVRDTLWDWCRPRYPYQVTEGLHLTEPWVKALATMPAIEMSDADIVVVADADVVCNGLAEAVAAVQDGAPWAVPHRHVHRLTADATTRLIAGENPGGLPLEQEPYLGIEGGGIVVLRRETALQVPMDPRFVAWGQEDLSWAMALHTLCGPCWRGKAALTHLWHPHPPRMDRKRGSPENWALFRRYCHARESKQTMEALIGEVRESLGLAQPVLHDRASLYLRGGLVGSRDDHRYLRQPGRP